MDIEHTPIPSFDYLERAEEFFEAYRDLLRQGIFDWARYLLIGHAVEVALKAYLLTRGWRVDALRRIFGHDLFALLAEANHNGLAIRPEVERDMRHLNHAHRNCLA